MKQLVIHQTIHGYRDGHRLLHSSLQIGTDAARTLLVMSDMSGPSMQSGFEEYLTGYPLPGTSFYVLAKTWYASEMKRPGCVWTHSLLIRHEDLVKIDCAASLLHLFRYPIPVEEEINFEPLSYWNNVNQLSGMKSNFPAGMIESIVEVLYDYETRPVLILGETAAQFEELILSLWFQQWPRLRAAFSFCTGALAPRTCNNLVLDLQVVPRAVSPSQYRKISNIATVVDPFALSISKEKHWVNVITTDLYGTSNAGFRRWLFTCAELEFSRSLVKRFASLFRFWTSNSLPEPRDLLCSVDHEFTNTNLNHNTASRLLKEIFDRYDGLDKGVGESSVLKALAVGAGNNVFSLVTKEIENRIHQLFQTNKSACLTLLESLLTTNRSSIGENIVKAIFTNLDINDALKLAISNPKLLPMLVHENPQLACSPNLWSQSRANRRELIYAIRNSNFISMDIMRAIVNAVIKAKAEDVADDLFRDIGEMAINTVMDAIQSGEISLNWQWKNGLIRYPESLVGWLEHRGVKNEEDLALVAKLGNPNDKKLRQHYGKLWLAHLKEVKDNHRHDRIVAAFGLAIGLGGAGFNDLIIGYFQDVFDALEDDSLDNYAWDWIKDYAPSLKWWRDWDKCERVAVAVANRFLEDDVSPGDFLRAIRNKLAHQHAIDALRDRADGRTYIKQLYKAFRSERIPSFGDALLGGAGKKNIQARKKR